MRNVEPFHNYIFHFPTKSILFLVVNISRDIIDFTKNAPMDTDTSMFFKAIGKALKTSLFLKIIQLIGDHTHIVSVVFFLAFYFN